MNFWFSVSTNGGSTQLCHKWKNYFFLARVRVCLIVNGGNPLWKWRLISFFVITNRLFEKTIRTITAKQQFLFLLPERSVQNVATRFAFKTFITTFIIFSLYAHRHTSAADKILQDKKCFQWWLELTFEALQSYKSFDQTLQKTNLFVSGRNIAHLVQGLALKTLIITSFERIKNSFYARKLYPNTLYSDNIRSQKF